MGHTRERIFLFMIEPCCKSQEIVPSYSSVSEYEEELIKRGNFGDSDFYPRDGRRLLTELEAKAAQLAGMDADELILSVSGMSAVVSAVESLQLYRGQAAQKIAAAKCMYGQTRAYVAQQEMLGREVVYFDSSNSEEIERKLTDFRPDIVVSETVGNGPGVPVLNVESILRICREVKAGLVLDNTLPLSTGLPLSETISDEDEVLVVESGTKSYTYNKEMLGVTYSKNSELLRTVRTYRRNRGFVPAIGQLERIQQLLPDEASFHEHNQSLFRNNEAVAKHLYAATADNSGIKVSHPKLPGVRCEGESPLLYVSCPVGEQFEVAERLMREKEVRELAGVGQSFGFKDTTQILPEEDRSAVRIAVAAKTDAHRLGAALSRAILAE